MDAKTAETKERYNPREAEPYWQKAWEEAGCFTASEDPSRRKYYVLRCSLTHPGAFTWATCATTQWAM